MYSKTAEKSQAEADTQHVKIQPNYLNTGKIISKWKNGYKKHNRSFYVLFVYLFIDLLMDKVFLAKHL